MPTGQKLKGNAEVMPWLRAGAASRKEPVTISDLAAKDWGIFEYWNIGVVTEELVAFGNQHKWRWPKDPNGLIGQKYKVAQCFVWHLNAEGKVQYDETVMSSRHRNPSSSQRSRTQPDPPRVQVGNQTASATAGVHSHDHAIIHSSLLLVSAGVGKRS